MGRLNQVIAVVAGKKAVATERITDAYHKIQKADLFSGIARTYQPRDEDGEKLPPESKTVQINVKGLIGEVAAALTDMFDIVATQDKANTEATGEIIVDGTPLLSNVPVTHLLFLEKQVNDLKTFVGKLPTLDPAEDWKFDTNADCYASVPSQTTKTKKIHKPFVKYEATKEHPAQVDVVTEDVIVGDWRTVKFSGAIPAQEKNAMLERVRRLHEAIIKAREQANSIEVVEQHVGSAIVQYVFEGRAQS